MWRTHSCAPRSHSGERILLLLTCLTLTPLQATSHEEIVDLFASMAAALTAANVPQFMDAFDKKMPEYGKLENDITALVNQAEVSSSIEPLKDDGDDSKRTVALDWYLEVRSRQQDGPLVRRRETIHCELSKQGKKWKIVALKPLEFFAAPKLDK